MTGSLAVFQQVLTKAERFEVALPKAVEVGRRRLAELIHRQAPPSEDIRAALGACLTEGRDPFEDPQMLDLAARQAFSDSTIQGMVNDVLERLYEDHAVEMLAAFGQRFDQAADHLRAGSAAGGSQLIELASAEVRQADHVISEIQLVWKFLSVLTLVPAARGFELLVIADVEPKDWVAAGLDVEPLKVGPWDAVCAGFPLSLATPETFLERKQAVVDYPQAQQAQIEAERRQERHRAAKPREAVSLW